jgi:hypothetical protein
MPKQLFLYLTFNVCAAVVSAFAFKAFALQSDDNITANQTKAFALQSDDNITANQTKAFASQSDGTITANRSKALPYLTICSLGVRRETIVLAVPHHVVPNDEIMNVWRWVNVKSNKTKQNTETCWLSKEKRGQSFYLRVHDFQLVQIVRRPVRVGNVVTNVLHRRRRRRHDTDAAIEQTEIECKGKRYNAQMRN